MEDGKISRAEYQRIISRGDEILFKHGLKKQNLPAEEISNPNWCLVYDGKRYSWCLVYDGKRYSNWR
jgi:hypothetical protein